MTEISSLRISIAKTFLQRARGLIGRARMETGEGLYFANARSVHTFGMLFAIDVVYIDELGVIVAIHESLKPWRLSWCGRAQNLCEMGQGVAVELGLKPGQKWPIESLDTGLLHKGKFHVVL
jgi:uncharacterized protein